MTGTLVIRWENRDRIQEPKKFWVTFDRTDSGFERGAQPRMEIIGEDALREYLISIQQTREPERRKEFARQWMLEIQSAGHKDLENTVLTDEQSKPFQRT